MKPLLHNLLAICSLYFHFFCRYQSPGQLHYQLDLNKVDKELLVVKLITPGISQDEI